MLKTTIPVAALLVLYISGPAWSLTAGPAPSATYPVSAHLTLGATTDQRCLKVPGSDRTYCGAVEDARIAFASAVVRMFESRPNPDLQLVLTVADTAILETAIGGLDLVLDTRVQVLSPAGELLDQVEAVGRVAILDTNGLEAAAAEAARAAARDFEIQYARSGAVASFLVGNRIAPAAAVAIPERSRTVTTLSFGLGLVQGDDDSTMPVPSVCVARSFGRLAFQVVYSLYGSDINGGIRGKGEVLTGDLGLEAGAVFRFTPTIELRAGPGIHFLHGNADTNSTSSSFVKIAPALFASLSAAMLPLRSGFRFLFGVEARAYFGTTVDLPEISRSASVANNSLSVFFGGEFPWGATGGAP
jgi:hypothetical protein